MRSLSLLAALALGAVAVTGAKAPPTGTCYALAMAGGGDRAAYEAGVLRGLTENLPAEQVAYEVVTGISAGSTLTATFSIFPLGQEKKAVDFTYGIISDLTQSAIFRQWPGGIVEGLLNHSSIFDSTPLRDLFTTVLSGHTLAADRLTCMGVSELQSGLFERLCDHRSVADVVDATVASAAIPAVFLDQTIGNKTYVDGGTLVSVDVIGAIEGCLARGYAERQVVVDVIECGGQNSTTLPGDASQLTALPVILRAYQMRQFNNDQSDYEAAIDAYPDATFRFRIKPTEHIPGSSLDFNQTTMAFMQKLGEQDGRDAVLAHKKQRANGAAHLLTRIALD